MHMRSYDIPISMALEAGTERKGGADKGREGGWTCKSGMEVRSNYLSNGQGNGTHSCPRTTLFRSCPCTKVQSGKLRMPPEHLRQPLSLSWSSSKFTESCRDGKIGKMRLLCFESSPTSIVNWSRARPWESQKVPSTRKTFVMNQNPPRLTITVFEPPTLAINEFSQQLEVPCSRATDSLLSESIACHEVIFPSSYLAVPCPVARRQWTLWNLCQKSRPFTLTATWPSPCI